LVTGKYANHIVRKPVEKGVFGPQLMYYGDTDYKSDFTLMFLRVTEPVLMEDSPHAHDFDMYLYFLSFDPNNFEDLGADIEIGLGKEQEIHKITSPCSVYIPKGLIHCPLNFKKVTKPICFIHASLAPKYYKLPNT
jgi:hypothetical protein